MALACSKTCEDRHWGHEELCRCLTGKDHSQAFSTDIARSNGIESPQVLTDSLHPSTAKFTTLARDNATLSGTAARWLCSKHRNGTCSDSIRCSSDCDTGHSNCGRCRTSACLRRCKVDGCGHETEAVNGATGNQGKTETGAGCVGNCGTGDPQGKGCEWRCLKQHSLTGERSNNLANSIDGTEGHADVIGHHDSVECSATKRSSKHETYRVEHSEEQSKVVGGCEKLTNGPSRGKLECECSQGDRRNKGDDGETNCCERSCDQGEALVIDESALFDTDRRNDAEGTVKQVGVCRECHSIGFYCYHDACHWMLYPRARIHESVIRRYDRS